MTNPSENARKTLRTIMENISKLLFLPRDQKLQEWRKNYFHRLFAKQCSQNWRVETGETLYKLSPSTSCLQIEIHNITQYQLFSGRQKRGILSPRRRQYVLHYETQTSLSLSIMLLSSPNDYKRRRRTYQKMFSSTIPQNEILNFYQVQLLYSASLICKNRASDVFCT